MRRAFALSNRNLTSLPASRRIVPTVMSNASRKRFAFPSMSGIRPIKPQSDVSACKQANHHLAPCPVSLPTQVVGLL